MKHPLQKNLTPVQSLILGDVGAEIGGLNISAMESNAQVGNAMEAIARKRTSKQVSPQDASTKVKTLLQNTGRPLPEQLRISLEGKFGVDLSRVRVHTGSKADAAVTAVQAEAFASGSNIAFASGKYDPSSGAGKELIAHEVAHVVQHMEGRIGTGSDVVNGVSVTTPFDSVEMEADSMAKDFIAQSSFDTGSETVGHSAVGNTSGGLVMRKVDPSLEEEKSPTIEEEKTESEPESEQQIVEPIPTEAPNNDGTKESEEEGEINSDDEYDSEEEEKRRKAAQKKRKQQNEKKKKEEESNQSC